MRTKSKPTRRTQASLDENIRSDSTGLISYYSDSRAYQNAVSATKESPLSHCDLVSFLANAQCEGVDILPVTWQPALENVGEGGTAQINQSIINARLNFVFKRTNVSSLVSQDSRRDLLTYHALISEVRVLRSRLIRDHPNIVQLQGICWDPISDPETVRPVLVFEKAHFGDMKAYMGTNLGQSLSTDDRIQLIIALASALQLMHSRGVIHGDIKPANVLMFCDSTGKIVPKMADFGYSTIVHQSDGTEKIKMPRSRPWDAPEHTFGPCDFMAASRMDVFSLGMICLWILCHDKARGESVLLPSSEIDAIDLPTGWSWTQSIENWKTSNHLIRLAKCTVLSCEHLTENQRDQLDRFFTSALQTTPADREHDVWQLLQTLEREPPLEPDLDSENFLTDKQRWQTSAVHPLFQIQKIVLSLGGSDCRVRSHLYRCLLEQASSNSCLECSRNAAYQLALCSRLGFCTTYDEPESDQWLHKSQNSRNRLDGDLEKILGTVSSRPHHNPKISTLFDSGHLIPLDYASEYTTFENFPSLRKNYISEIKNAKQGMGSDSPVVFSLRASLVSILFHENLLDEAEKMERELIAELEHDSKHGVDHVLLWNHHAMLGVICFTQGRWIEAESIQREAVYNFTRLLGQDHVSTLVTTANLSLSNWSQGNVAEAERLQHLVIKHLGQALGEENIATLAALNDMAAIFYRQCRYYESAALFRKVLASKEKLLGTKDRSTLNTMGNLALPLKHLGHFEEAETLNRTALNARQHVLGPKHSEVITNMNNLAALLQMQGKYIEAKALYQQALEISTSTIGADHPDTLTSKNNLASVLQDLGLFHDALTMYLETLKAKEEHPGLGPYHTLTLDTLTNLGMIYEELGDYSKALECHERVLRSRRKADKGRVLVFSALQILGSLYQRMGLYEKAGECIKESLIGLETTLGPEDLATLAAVQALASLYANSERSEEALLLCTRALRGREKILGAEHKLVLDTVDAIGELYYTMGDFQIAEQYARRALAGRETVLGLGHPDSLTSASNLSRALHGHIIDAGDDHKDLLEASQLAARALSGMEETMGLDHPETMHMAWRMASLRFKRREFEEAKQLYQQAHEGLVKKLGPDHPDCRKCLKESKNCS